jgi:hypothetical protein
MDQLVWVMTRVDLTGVTLRNILESMDIASTPSMYVYICNRANVEYCIAMLALWYTQLKLNYSVEVQHLENIANTLVRTRQELPSHIYGDTQPLFKKLIDFGIPHYLLNPYFCYEDLDALIHHLHIPLEFPK